MERMLELHMRMLFHNDSAEPMAPIDLISVLVKGGGTGLKSPEIATQVEPIPFVRAGVADRQYRLTVLEEFVTLLCGQTTGSDGRVCPAVIREARECLKQAAIDDGGWAREIQAGRAHGSAWNHRRGTFNDLWGCVLVSWVSW